MVLELPKLTPKRRSLPCAFPIIPRAAETEPNALSPPPPDPAEILQGEHAYLLHARRLRRGAWSPLPTPDQRAGKSLHYFARRNGCPMIPDTSLICACAPDQAEGHPVVPSNTMGAIPLPNKLMWHLYQTASHVKRHLETMLHAPNGEKGRLFGASSLESAQLDGSLGADLGQRSSQALGGPPTPVSSPSSRV